MGRTYEDVPAQVVDAQLVIESRGKGVQPWAGHRVYARFEHAGSAAWPPGWSVSCRPMGG